jgi:hypothetical protein
LNIIFLSFRVEHELEMLKEHHQHCTTSGKEDKAQAATLPGHDDRATKKRARVEDFDFFDYEMEPGRDKRMKVEAKGTPLIPSSSSKASSMPNVPSGAYNPYALVSELMKKKITEENRISKADEAQQGSADLTSRSSTAKSIFTSSSSTITSSPMILSVDSDHQSYWPRRNRQTRNDTENNSIVLLDHDDLIEGDPPTIKRGFSDDDDDEIIHLDSVHDIKSDAKKKVKSFANRSLLPSSTPNSSASSRSSHTTIKEPSSTSPRVPNSTPNRPSTPEFVWRTEMPSLGLDHSQTESEPEQNGTPNDLRVTGFLSVSDGAFAAQEISKTNVEEKSIPSPSSSPSSRPRSRSSSSQKDATKLDLLESCVEQSVPRLLSPVATRVASPVSWEYKAKKK